MTTNLPAPRPRPVPAQRQVLAGEVLRPTGSRYRIRNTWCIPLPGEQLVLDGPTWEVAQIVDLWSARGEVLKATAGSPSRLGMMLTLTMRPPTVAGRTAVSRPPRVRPWSRRRQVIVFGSLPLPIIAMVVVSIVWPLVGMGAAAGLLLLAYLLKVGGDRFHRRNVPHVAIDHVD